MIVGVPKETAPGERRVSLVPDGISKLVGVSVLVEKGAGDAAGFTDQAYIEKGASIAFDTSSLYNQCDVILKVTTPTPSEAVRLKEGCTIISLLYPLANLEAVRVLTSRKATAFAMELLPRISRAQSMDALSSQSNLGGYKAVLLAAESLPRIFPMMMTAAGTLSPAKVFVVGAGVAGLQAIATARRMGALVEAYDLRPVVKEQVESLGARFAQVPIEAKDAQDSGGYAKAQTEDFYLKQQKFLAERAQVSDVVITTALIPGQRAPTLISEDAVKGMRTGSVIVDLAAEQGGNCALTEPGKTVIKHGVTIIGPLNLPSTMAPQASQLYSRNVTSFLSTMMKEGRMVIDANDELVRGSLVISNGEIVHPPTRAAVEGAQRK
jgi:H+-translocating NAD(P) transhydrogenase subunit alpha